jgi:hypothetical protein
MRYNIKERETTVAKEKKKFDKGETESAPMGCIATKAKKNSDGHGERRRFGRGESVCTPKICCNRKESESFNFKEKKNFNGYEK